MAQPNLSHKHTQFLRNWTYFVKNLCRQLRTAFLKAYCTTDRLASKGSVIFFSNDIFSAYSRIYQRDTK